MAELTEVTLSAPPLEIVAPLSTSVATLALTLPTTTAADSAVCRKPRFGVMLASEAVSDPIEERVTAPVA